MDDAKLSAALNAIVERTRALDAANTALYNNMMQVDRSDPRFTARMRQYGILPQMQAIFAAMGELMQVLAPVVDEFGKRLQL